MILRHMLAAPSSAKSKQLLLTAAVGVSCLSALAGPTAAQELQLQGGGIVGIAPKYEGSSEYRFVGAPILAPADSNGLGFVSFKGIDDVRFKLLDSAGFEAGPLGGYRFDRDEDDGDLLRGLGDVDGGLIIGGYVAYNKLPITPFVSYHHQVTGDNTGALVRFGLERDLAFARGITVNAFAGATWADDDYAESYFGISAAQAARSPLAEYDAEAGIKDVYLGFTSAVPIDDRWTARVNARYSRLVGDAADSPIVETEDQFSGGLGLTYKFSIQR